MTPPGLSACVIAKDEADRIKDCLASLAFCDEIVVVDAHSRDDTREIAAAGGARVIERDWPGHVAQKEFAIRAARHDWVLCVDADERISPELETEIRRLHEAGFPGPPGWRLPRLSSYLGRPIRHGTWYPDPAAPPVRPPPRTLGRARSARPRAARRRARPSARTPAP